MLVTRYPRSPILSAVPKEQNVSETERLDRIERHIQQLAQAHAALQQELKIARQLAISRQRAVQPHGTASTRRRAKKRT
ncbi:MAG: hypothetical protein JWL71_4625 [Acidobacteria bacterium]|nr:hypothetical protein [Acidobacteriota bacterium]